MKRSLTIYVDKDDDIISRKLIDLARRHCKLALEHVGKETLRERRQAIRIEIESLRAERESLLDSFVEEGLA